MIANNETANRWAVGGGEGVFALFMRPNCENGPWTSMKTYLLGDRGAFSMCVDSASGKSLAFIDLRELNILTFSVLVVFDR